MTQDSPLLSVEHLTVEHVAPGGLVVTAVRDVSFTLGSRETVALVGESGSGKSTLAAALLRFLPIRQGAMTLQIDGKTVDLATLNRSQLRTARRHIQIVFQDAGSSFDPRHRLFRSVTESQIAFGELRGRAAMRRQAQALLEQVGLDATFVDRFPHELSGGQRQRAGIARAIAIRPRLLVLDEAVSAQDLSVRAQILNLLLDLRERAHLAMLFITHDLGVARVLADRVLVMHQGTIVEAGPVDQVFESPTHPYTQALLQSARSVEIP